MTVVSVFGKPRPGVYWLGLDSSLRAFGFAVFRDFGIGPECLEAGTWKTKQDAKASTKSADSGRRVVELAAHLCDLVNRVRPDAAFVEATVFVPASGFITGAQLGRVRGMVDGVMVARGVPLYEFNPQRVKRAVCGTPKASKLEVAARMEALYEVRGDENATDAAAVAHLGATHEAVQWHIKQRAGA